VSGACLAFFSSLLPKPNRMKGAPVGAFGNFSSGQVKYCERPEWHHAMLENLMASARMACQFPVKLARNGNALNQAPGYRPPGIADREKLARLRSGAPQILTFLRRAF
jgi:hypothetical protein